MPVVKWQTVPITDILIPPNTCDDGSPGHVPQRACPGLESGHHRDESILAGTASAVCIVHSPPEETGTVVASSAHLL